MDLHILDKFLLEGKQKSPYQHHMNVNFKSPNLIYWGLCNLFLKNKVISNRGHILLALQAQKDMSQILKIMPLESKKQMEIRPGTLYCYYDQNNLSTGKNKVDEVNHNKSYAFQMLHLDTKETDDIVNLVKHISGNSKLNTVACGAEAGQFAAEGFQAAICGPGSIEQAHRANEFITKDELVKGKNMMGKLIIELSSSEFN